MRTSSVDKIHLGGFFMQTESRAMSHAKVIAVGAVCLALAFALNQVSLFRMPLGGSITPFSMAFIVLAGYWLGPVYGIVTGVAMGLLDIATGATLHPGNPLLSALMDYPLAFGALGLSGLFRKMKHGLIIGYIGGVLGRFAFVFASGFIIWGGMLDGAMNDGAVWFSFTYNMAYIAPEAIASLIILSLPAVRGAINVVTRQIVPADVYEKMQMRANASTVSARFITGTVLSAMGGVAFAVSAYVARLTDFAITQAVTGQRLFNPYLLNSVQESVFNELNRDPHRLYRVVSRTLEHTLALNIAGALLLTLGIALALSCVVKFGQERIPD
jgi:thiamine transporter